MASHVCTVCRMRVEDKNVSLAKIMTELDMSSSQTSISSEKQDDSSILSKDGGKAIKEIEEAPKNDAGISKLEDSASNQCREKQETLEIQVSVSADLSDSTVIESQPAINTPKTGGNASEGCSNPDLNPEIHLDSTNDRSSGVCCVVCLGVFHPGFLADLAARIKENVEKGYEDAESFSIALGLPSSSVIREIVARNVLNCSENPLELKLTFKHCITTLLSRIWDLKYDAYSDLKVTVAIQNEQLLRADLDALEIHYEPETKKKRWFGRRKSEKSEKEIPNFSKKTDLAMAERAAKSVQDFAGLPEIVKACSVEITTTRTPLFFVGRYNKYSRFLNQTTWMIDGQTISDGSVDEIVSGPLLAAAGCTRHSFTASGREDMDVRMLGTGRPFMAAMENPRRKSFDQDQINRLETQINASSQDVKVTRLATTAATDLTQRLKLTEETKTKQYAALCYLPTGVDREQLDRFNAQYSSKGLTVKQRTPLRVMHRRSVCERERTIHNAHALPVDAKHFYLHITTQAGTYVKEFVHGDLGRTSPCLGDLLKRSDVDILDLDVMHVDMEWP